MNIDIVNAVRNELIGSGALVALVPASKVIMARGALPAAYPSIALSEDLIEDGNAYNMEGLFYVRIYAQTEDDLGAFDSLSAIHKLIIALLSREGAALNITDAAVTFHEFRQVFASEPIHEPVVDINTWSMTTNYACKVTI